MAPVAVVQVVPELYPGAARPYAAAVEAGHLPSGEPVRLQRWGWLDVLITFAGWIVLSTIAGVLLIGLGGTSTGKQVGILIGVALPWLALAGWPLLSTRLKGNGPIVDLGLRINGRDVVAGIGYGILALALALLIGLATQKIFGDFSSAAGDLVKDFTNPLALAAFAVLVAVGAPIAEELAFRGLLLTSMAKLNWGPWISVGLSALAFSLFHFEPIRIPLLLSTGLVLGIARWRSGSTVTAIVAHMVNNGFAVASIFLS